MEIVHYPVMHREVLENLPIPEGDTLLVDCTTGEGGHTSLFLNAYPSLTVTGIDRDSEIQKKAIERLSGFGGRFRPVNAWFDDALKEMPSNSADAILFDLGISMFHFVESDRGFSFRSDEPLDMRLDPGQGMSAADVVNGYSEENLADVIYRYGEERYSRRIAHAIVQEREKAPIESSETLASIIRSAVPKDYRYGRIHPATRTFQALRIEVNSELDRITPALENAIRVLKKGGRIAVITFHSLEDRKVKWFFKDEAARDNARIRILTKKPIIPSAEEEEENPPSRSAKLRVVEKIQEGPEN
ncbi:MAG: 16S rRNA (cytosine(1402)-N(4))-methyltransferase RsmH [Spirochaetes bacterium]|uniref:Ribosomal RNA small subunit methyltransferase H n=1 Tax=Candidatus Ornithospirochaeta stercoripullorum TaxID=2840899 RepID=A0A9D9E4L1_9SPIO|nr:16S rRNA (cytosine(1402)-N(4))-methyltransferase RsmH [Candidatus Ornithospirochaeta stercoripullorum]